METINDSIGNGTEGRESSGEWNEQIAADRIGKEGGGGAMGNKAKAIRNQLIGKYKDVESGCWEWTASYNGAGYGQLMVTMAPGKHSPMNASRAAYIAFVGPIADGMDVCHKCDNQKCINPDHLFLGTRQENIQDAKSKGRLPQGECRPNAKLNAESISEIRKLQSGGESQRSLAGKFKISVSRINHIIRRKAWAHVP